MSTRGLCWRIERQTRSLGTLLGCNSGSPHPSCHNEQLSAGSEAQHSPQAGGRIKKTAPQGPNQSSDSKVQLNHNHLPTSDQNAGRGGGWHTCTLPPKLPRATGKHYFRGVSQTLNHRRASRVGVEEAPESMVRSAAEAAHTCQVRYPRQQEDGTCGPSGCREGPRGGCPPQGKKGNAYISQLRLGKTHTLS